MNTDRDNATPETFAPLTWTRKKEFGSEGMTHRAIIEIAGHRHSFAVDSPRKGYWVARGWRDGDMDLYREATTMKDAKAMAQSHAKQAARMAADAEARQAAEAKPLGRALPGEGAELLGSVRPASARPEPNLSTAEDPQEAAGAAADLRALRAVDEAAELLAEHKTDACETCKGSGADPEDPGDYDGTVHMYNPFTAGPCPACDGTGQRVPQAVGVAQAAEYLVHFRGALNEVMAPAVARANRMMRAFGWHMQHKCTCPTPSHRMSCGEGGKARVVQGGAA